MAEVRARDPRVALLCIDPLRAEHGDFKPFNYSVRKVQASLVGQIPADVEVRVFEYTSREAAAFLEELERFDPDVIGASTYVWSFPTFFEVARALKRRRPDRLVVFGGPSARSELFALPPFRDGASFVDALVLGEGEEVFREIVTLGTRRREELARVAGLSLSNGTAFVLTPERALPVLDGLPSPFQLGLVAGVKTAHLETFRGCPLSCTFCQWGDLSKANRIFSVDYLVRELGAYKAMGLRSAMIVDAALNLNPRAFRNLRAAEREVRFFADSFLHTEIYPQYINDDHLEFLREVGGGLNLGLGLQSYDRGVLGNVERPFDERKFERVVRELLTITSRTELEIIMGLPGDNPESFRRTLHRALGLGTSVRVYHCLVLPNALMSRAPAHFGMEFDPIDLSMIRCLGWEGDAIARMAEELTTLVQSIPGAFLHNDGFGWHFPSAVEAAKGEAGFHYMLTGTIGDGSPVTPRPSGHLANLPADVALARLRSGAANPDATTPSLRTTEPALYGALVSEVRRSTSGMFELIEATREGAGVLLSLRVPGAELQLDVRPASASPSYRTVDGVAYSYRRPPKPFEAVVMPTLERLLGSLPPFAATMLAAPESAAKSSLPVVP